MPILGSMGAGSARGFGFGRVDGGTPPPPVGGWTSNVITSTGINGGTTPGLINIYYRRSILCWRYTAAEMTAATGKTAGIITGLRFTVSQAPANQPLPTYAIGFKNGSFGAANPGSTGYTVVKSASSESFTQGAVKTFTLSPTFNWSGGDLAITMAWGQCPVNYSATGQSPTGAGDFWYTWQDGAGTYTINTDVASNLMTGFRPVVQLQLS